MKKEVKYLKPKKATQPPRAKPLRVHLLRPAPPTCSPEPAKAATPPPRQCCSEGSHRSSPFYGFLLLHPVLVVTHTTPPVFFSH